MKTGQNTPEHPVYCLRHLSLCTSSAHFILQFRALRTAAFWLHRPGIPRIVHSSYMSPASPPVFTLLFPKTSFSPLFATFVRPPTSSTLTPLQPSPVTYPPIGLSKTIQILNRISFFFPFPPEYRYLIQRAKLEISSGIHF
jgi:hypothetical protein